MNDQIVLPKITDDEKTMATLAHILQLVGGWIAPLIIYLVKRDSKFVAFHAMQALLWQLIVMVFWFGVMIVWFVVIFSTVLMHAGKEAAAHPPPPMFFVGAFAIWLAVFGLMSVNLVIAIIYGIKAGRGQWAAYPVIGRLAHRIVGV